MRAPKQQTTLYLKAVKMETSVARPSRISVGTHLMFFSLEVKGAATDASADDREMPVLATFSAPQSLQPSPHMATWCLRDNNHVHKISYILWMSKSLHSNYRKI